MSAYIVCPKCGEDTLDVDTLRCDECGYDGVDKDQPGDGWTRGDGEEFFGKEGILECEKWWNAKYASLKRAAQDLIKQLEISDWVEQDTGVGHQIKNNQALHILKGLSE